MTRKTLADAITNAIAMTGLKNYQVAAMVRRSPSLVGDWANGVSIPVYGDMVVLEEALGLKRGTLTKFIGIAPPAPRPVSWRQGIVDALVEAPLTSADAKYLMELVDAIVALRGALGPGEEAR